MNQHTIPELPLKQLNRISPSKFFSLKSCILREVWAADPHIMGLLPASPTIKIGTVVHRTLELTVKGLVKSEEEAIEQWDKEVEAVEFEMSSNWLERHLLPLSKRARYYEVKRQQCLIMVRSILGSGGSNGIGGSVFTQAEVWVESDNGKVAGKIDLVRQTSEGIQIVDYKTGAVLDTNVDTDVVKQEYQQQLKIYAALYKEKYNIWPEDLLITTLGHREYDIPFTRIECTDLLKSASNRLDEVNAIISNAESPLELASPNPDNCKYCAYRPACEAYKMTRDKSGLWPIDCFGRIADIKILNSGSLRVVIDDGVNNVVVRGLDPKRNQILNNNYSEIYFYNLTEDSVPSYYKENLLTTCYYK